MLIAKSSSILVVVLVTLFSFAVEAQIRTGDVGAFFNTKGRAGYEADIAYIISRTTEDKGSINGINPEFAAKMAAFLRAAPAEITVEVGRYGLEGLPSVKDKGIAYCQRKQCREGTNSHPRGLAIDLFYNNTNGEGGPGASAWCRSNALCTWAHQNAPQYGLMFRLMPESGCPSGYYEPWHIELQGVGNCMGNDPGGGGGGGSFLNGLAGLVREVLKNPTVTPPQYTQMVTTTTATSTIGISQLFGTPTSTPVTSTTSSSNAIADRLEILAFGPQASTSSTTQASVPLVVTTAHAVSLSGTRPATTMPDGGQGIVGTQSTFSADLSWQQSSGTNLSGWQAFYIQLKSVLQRILALLTPFDTEEDYSAYGLY